MKVLLGTNHYGEGVYLHKHSWDCDWYWGFGHLSTKTSHTHFKYVAMRHDLHGDRWTDINHTLKHTNITQSEWWVILDLFKQAYALHEAAAVYQYGGHLCGRTELTYLINDKEQADRLNADLEKVLDAVWEFVRKAVKPKDSENK